MPQPTTANPQAYRQLQFQAGHILQAREVQAVQALIGDEVSNNNYLLGGLFPEGATLNVTPSIQMGTNNATVTLTKTNSTQPMLVYVNGRFEKVDVGGAVSVVYAQVANGTTVTMYANWTLWRVTSNGDRGSIQDLSLIDSTTGETVAEMGQLQLSFGADQSGAVPAATSSVYTIFNKNTSPLPMLTFQWQGGVLVWTGATGPQPGLLASTMKPGLVTTTTGATQVVSNDDVRNSNARNPNPASVNSTNITSPVATGSDAGLSYRDQNGLIQPYPAAGVQTSDASGGVDSNRIWDAGWKTTLDKCLGFMGTQLAAVWGTLQSFGQRLFALENKPTVNYDWHVGSKLGRQGSLATTHPPVIDNTDPATGWPGFAVVGGSNTSTPNGAYGVVRADGVTRNAIINFDGNYVLMNPDYTSALQAFGYDFRDYISMAGAVINFMASLPGTSVATGVRVIRLNGWVYSIFAFGNPNESPGQPGKGVEIGIGGGVLLNNQSVPIPPGFQGQLINASVASVDGLGHPITYINVFSQNSLVSASANLLNDAGQSVGAQITAGCSAVIWRFGY